MTDLNGVEICGNSLKSDPKILGRFLRDCAGRHRIFQQSGPQ
jgi:hypothetical protein